MLQKEDVMCCSVNCATLTMVRIAIAGKWCAGPLWVDGTLEAVCCHHCCGYAGELKLAGRPWLSFCCSDIAEVICPRSLQRASVGEMNWAGGIGNDAATLEPHRKVPFSLCCGNY